MEDNVFIFAGKTTLIFRKLWDFVCLLVFVDLHMHVLGRPFLFTCSWVTHSVLSQNSKPSEEKENSIHLSIASEPYYSQLLLASLRGCQGLDLVSVQ